MKIPKSPMRPHKQAGYSLLMVVFMVATITLLMAAATPNVLTTGTREREEEMVWRGRQYQRAIGLYFRKLGRPPVQLDDLTNQTAGVRFLRKAYKNPFNKEDGTWRLIYLGPNGQLMGSLLRTNLQQPVLTHPATAPGATSSSSQESQPQPLGGPVIGGNIIGVGGTGKQPSLRVYEGGDTYEKWEFIYNPTGQVSTLPPQATPGTGGTSQPSPQAPQLPLQPQTPGQ